MGQYWLHDMYDILLPGVGRGIQELVPIPGNETRSRSSGGLDSIDGLLDHHTASPESWDWWRDIEYIAFTNPNAPSPISQLYGGRRGQVALIACGAANHGGLGGAYKPGGPFYVGVNKANTRLIGKEMGNNGTGEQWPWEQIEASITVDALICLAEKWGPGHVFGHKEYCGPGTTTPGRKVDPWGPWENHPKGLWLPNSNWGGHQGTIDYYRQLVSKKMAELSQEINVMYGFVPRAANVKARVFDTRGPVGPDQDRYKVGSGHTITITLPGGAGKSHGIVNLVSTRGEAGGYFTAWASGERPDSSVINWAAWQTIANEVTIPLAADGSFKLWTSVRAHVLVDLVGFYQKL